MKTKPETVMLVLVLMANGCPIQAAVVAFGCDERTVKEWWRRAGVHCQKVHEQIVGQSQLDLQQVQADEIKVKSQKEGLWLAMGMMVSTRLWLGGVISPRRDKALIEALMSQVRAVALCRPLLGAVDGLSSYVGACQRAFRSKVPRAGQVGCCQLYHWPQVAIVQVIKQRLGRRLSIKRRIVQGSQAMIASLLQTSQGGGVINTAFIERLNATFRQRLACLARRSRALVRQPLPFFLLHRRRRWLHRTPAIVAGLIDHRWTVAELFWFKIPPIPWSPPKRRGRPSKETLRLMQRWCN